ncbi:apolipoprotein N-acyltransferase [Granulosicoccaceae sp. 1_MG-2023]|nr:apolipoprotein N-acyltransferase [Granulosicoccaceae sp. 1_MG-2023]
MIRALVQKPRFACLIALLAGGLMPLAFAPYEWRPLAFISPAVLFLLWQWLPPARLWRTGLCFQLGFFGVGVHWVYYSVHLFGHAVAPLAALVTALFVGGLALIVSLSAPLYRYLATGAGVIARALIFAAVWSLFEWIRGWLFGGFPWLLAGYSQIDTPLSALAPVFGVYGIGFLVVLCAALVVALVLGKRRQRLQGAWLAGAALLLVAVLHWPDWAQDRARALQVRMVQGNISQETKFERNALRETLDSYMALSRGDGQSPVDVVVWPETAIPTYLHHVSNYLAPFVREQAGQGTVVLSGTFEQDAAQHAYNSFADLSGGQLYRKSHLVPFGEFMPFRFVLDALAAYIDIPMSDLSAGAAGQAPMQAGGEKFGISICYEDVFGEEMRSQLPDATVLINVSNDTWFGDSAAPHQHQEIAAMRAREFSRPLVRVTNTGISSLISPRGEVLASIAQFEPGYLDVSVTPREGRTPYVVLGNYPVIALFSLIIAAAVWRRRRRSAVEATPTP